MALLIWILYDVMRFAKVKEATDKQKRGLAWQVGLKLVFVLIVIAALFVFFGPGTGDETPAIEDDGHHQMVKAREVPSEAEIKEEAKEKKEEYLKKIEKGPEEARKEADDYIKNALERSKKR